MKVTRRCPRCLRAYEEDLDQDEAAPASCEACGTELVTERAAAPPVAHPSYTEVVRVYEARAEADLGVVRALLEAADIPVFAWRGASAGLVGAFTASTLLVPTAFARKAEEVLRARGVLRAAPPPHEELGALWRESVVPLLAGPAAASLASEIALVSESLRTALFGSLESAGPRGLALLADLTLALAARGPLAAAREAASYLAACEAFRDQRADLARTLGALVARGADREIAARVTSALERFRGSLEAERALVPLLSHADAGVRDAAIEALFSISGGETLGYDPEAPEEVRRAAVRRWRERVGDTA